MSIQQARKPQREWVWLILALLVVGGISLPLWQIFNPAERSSEYWARWTPQRISKLLLGPEQIGCYFCFVWATFILMSRLREVYRQRNAFNLELLPTDEGARILPEDARPLVRKVDATTGRQPFILAKMIQLGLTKFAISRSPADVSEVVRNQTEEEMNRFVSGMSTASYLTWAIPAIGFLGTVRGLAGGMSKAGNQSDPDFIQQVTDQLGVAFDCTFVALAISLILTYILNLVQRSEETLMIDCQSYCQEHLLLRLYDPHPDRVEEWSLQNDVGSYK